MRPVYVYVGQTHSMQFRAKTATLEAEFSQMPSCFWDTRAPKAKTKPC